MKLSFVIMIRGDFGGEKDVECELLTSKVGLFTVYCFINSGSVGPNLLVPQSLYRILGKREMAAAGI